MRPEEEHLSVCAVSRAPPDAHDDTMCMRRRLLHLSCVTTEKSFPFFPAQKRRAQVSSWASCSALDMHCLTAALGCRRPALSRDDCVVSSVRSRFVSLTLDTLTLLFASRFAIRGYTWRDETIQVAGRKTKRPGVLLTPADVLSRIFDVGNRSTAALAAQSLCPSSSNGPHPGCARSIGRRRLKTGWPL